MRQSAAWRSIPAVADGSNNSNWLTASRSRRRRSNAR
jgi:hypothetical protein